MNQILKKKINSASDSSGIQLKKTDAAGLLATIINRSPNAIIVTDYRKRVLAWNMVAEQLFGIAEKEALRKLISTLGIIQFAKNEFSDIISGLKENVQFKKAAKFYRKDKTSFEADLVINTVGPFQEENGMIMMIIEEYNKPVNQQKMPVAVSIRSGKKAGYNRKQTSRLDQQFQALMFDGKDVINLFDESMRVIYRSPSAFRIGGYEDGEVIGMDLRHRVHPDDQAGLAARIAELKSSPGKKVSANFRYRRKDDTYLWLEGTGINLLHDENIRAIVFNYRDVSDMIKSSEKLKREREKLSILSDISPGMIFSFNLRTDGKFYFKYASKAIEDILGFRFEEVDDTIDSILVSQDEGNVITFIKGVMESAKDLSPWQQEFPYIHPVKGNIWLEGNSRPVKENDGSITWHGILIDITHRKRTEEQLLELGIRLKTVGNNLKGLTLFQISGESYESRWFTYISDSVTELTGTSPEAVIKNPLLLYNLILEEDRPAMALAELEALRNMTPFNVEVRTHNYKGEMRWLNIVSMPRKLEDGRIIFDGFNIDITDRKLSEESLRESEKKYRTLVDQVFDGVILYDQDGRIIDCNSSASQFTGYPYEELIGKPIAELLSWEELKERPLNIELIQKGKPVFDYRKLKRADGSMVEMELNTRLLPDGKLLVVGRDISEKKRAREQQELLASIVNSSDDAIISQDLEGTVSSWNKGAELVFGYTAEEMTGRNIDIISFNGFLQESLQLAEKIGQGEMVRHFETQCRKKDGSVISVSLSASPLKNRKGQVIGIAKIFRDITEEKRIREEMRISNERYEAVAKATSDAIWDHNFITGQTYVPGAGYKNLFGYKLANEHTDDLFWESKLHPDDREKVMAKLAKILRDPDIRYSSAEYRFLKANGSYAYLNDRYFIIRDQKGNPVRMLGAKRDITDIKESEQALKQNLGEKKMLVERMSTILNTLPAYIALINKDGGIVEENNFWRTTLCEGGLFGNCCRVGDNYLDICRQAGFLPDEETGNLIKGIKKVLSKKLEEFVYEYSFISDKGKKWYRMAVTSLQEKHHHGAVVMHFDISEIKELEEEKLRIKTEEQISITKAMLKGQEKERNKIAVELHDNVNQILAGTKILLSLIKDNPKNISRHLDACINGISQAIEENRKIAHELVAPSSTKETLKEQIERLGKTMLGNAGFHTALRMEGFTEDCLNEEMKLAVYRIVQEQCTNIVKYSGGKQVSFVLAKQGNVFFMEIKDDGKGMDPGEVHEGIGLHNIASRLAVFGGKSSVSTAAGKGFRLRIEIPL